MIPVEFIKMLSHAACCGTYVSFMCGCHAPMAYLLAAAAYAILVVADLVAALRERKSKREQKEREGTRSAA